MKMMRWFFIVALVAAANVHSADVSGADIAAAAAKAVDFLSKQQKDDGTFGASKESAMPGVVGMVVEALANSPAKLREANSPVVAKAVKYILSKQQPNGSITIPEFGLENYNTAVSVIGLAALENAAHKPVLEKARAFMLSCQVSGEVDEPNVGGFGYGPGKKADMSNTGFSLEALKAAGLEENSPTWKNAVKFISRCQDSETNDLPAMKAGNNSGGFVYVPGSSPFGTENARNGKAYVPRPYGSMTYEAVKSLVYAGIKKDEPTLAAAFKWIHANYAVKEHPGAVGNEGYYYYVLAFSKAFTAAGIKEVDLPDGKKANWAKDLAAHLITLQKPDGSFANADARWMEGNPILATSFALQALSQCANALK